jgi:cathepsin L
MTNVLEEFEQRFNKTYANKVESDMRMNTLKTNLRKVFKHNAGAYNGKKSYTIGVNQFSDMSFKEIINSKTGFKPTEDFTNVVKNKKSTSTTRHYKTSWSVDPYRAKYVTPVQNQVSLN